jgi:hypothetical protein
MVFVYIVRCNFTAPEQEQAWNDWYSGPKIAQMLRKPQFLSGQRFRLASGTGRTYLALWTLASPDAFKTAEYTSDWGFFEWERFVTDWSRDLFDGRPATKEAFAVERDGALQVVAFDDMSGDDAKAASAAIAKSEPEMRWLPVAGLDRHTPLIGLRPWPGLARSSVADSDRGKAIERAIYRPICDFITADRR